MTTFPHQGYVMTETSISMAINTILSVAFAWGLFHTVPQVNLGNVAVLRDVAPQTFMITLMSIIVPTLLTRKRCRAGVIAPLSGRRRLPRHIAVRALGGAVVTTVTATGAFALVRGQLGDVLLSLGVFILAKAIYGALLALLITPIAVVAALRDVEAPAST